MPHNSAIGFLDSGVGGISVMTALRTALPFEDFILYGDSANAPYGTKPVEAVRQLALNAAQKLMDKHIKALVIACNTITCVAGDTLKKALPVPVVGIVPAVEQAQLLRRQGDILVMGTPDTMAGDVMHRLLKEHGQHALPLSCPGLMEFVEKGELDSPRLHDYLKRLFAPYENSKIDVVALGCTHYPFLQKAIARFFSPDTVLIDGSARTLDELLTVLQEKDLFTAQKTPGTTQLYTSEGQDTLRLMETLLNQG